MLKNSDIGYSGINSARLSLSSFLKIEGYKSGKHPLVCKYIKGVFNINPSLPKYLFPLDVGKVPWELKTLSERIITLVSILCRQRASEIITAMDAKNIIF